MSELIIATVLPRWPDPGAASDDLALSVHLAPRLTPTTAGATLGDATSFPTLAGWGRLNVQCSVSAQGREPVPARILPDRRPDLWAALFPPTTPVRPHTPAPSGRAAALRAATPFSGPALHEAVQLAYGQSALRDTVLTQGSPALDPLRHTWSTPVVASGLAASITQFFDGPPLLREGARGSTATSASERSVLQPVSSVDFHTRLSYLHDFPDLLAACGLVLRITVPRPSGLLPAEVTITTQMTFSDDDGRATSARVVAATTTTVLDRGPAEGYLPAAAFSLTTLDTLHSASRLAATPGFLNRPAGADGIRPPLPAVPSTGLSILLTGTNGTPDRHLRLADALDRQDAWEQALKTADASAPTISLRPEHAVAGYLVDVWDGADRRWRSLCRRAGTVSVDGGPTVDLPADDEGMLSDTFSVRSDGGVRVTDVLARWQGWSLTVPPVPTAPPGRMPVPQLGRATSGGLHTSLTVPTGSLPPLRFGRDYRLRIRSVDVSGSRRPAPPLDGEPDDAPDEQTSSPAVTYARTQPLLHPVLAFRDQPGPGESIARLVATSAGGPGRFTGSGPDLRTSERWILPPQTTVDLAERHGVFDTATASPDSERIAAALNGRTGSLWSSVPDGPSDVATKQAFVAAQLHPEDDLGVPYLPDPLAAGVAVTIAGLDDAEAFGIGATGSIVFSFPTTSDPWPGAPEPLILQVHPVARNTVGSITLTERTLTFSVPQARTATVALSSVPRTDLLDHHVLPQWVAAASEGTDGAATLLTQWRQCASRGGVLPLSPPLNLTVGHAVRQPLDPPTLIGVPTALVRDVGSTTAGASCTVTRDPRSTQSIDVFADWTEPVDPPQAGATGRAHLVRLTVSGDPGVSGDQVDLSYDFHDTRHRVIQLRAVASTRFEEYFAPSLVPSTVSSPPVSVDLPATARPAPPTVVTVLPTVAWSESVNRTTAQSVRTGNGLRIWLESPWLTSGADQQLAVLIADGTPVVQLSESSHASVWGSDPAAGGAPPPSLSAASFPLATGSVDNLSVPGAAMPLTGALHPVSWDPDSERWYCDVDLAGLDDLYGPFVRLSVAAYQPSVVGADEDLRVSAAVDLGWHQLAPLRHFSASLNESTLATSKGMWFFDYSLFGPSFPDATKGATQVYLSTDVGEVRVLNTDLDLPNQGWPPNAGQPPKGYKPKKPPRWAPQPLRHTQVVLDLPDEATTLQIRVEDYEGIGSFSSEAIFDGVPYQDTAERLVRPIFVRTVNIGIPRSV